MRTNKSDVFKVAYKSAIISGMMMLTNDAANNVCYSKVSTTPFGKILRNLAATAGGYFLGSKVADYSYAAIERAIDKYREEV